MTRKRCIKCGTIEDYLDIDERCSYCKGALVKIKVSKGPDELAKLAWKACDMCYATGCNYDCARKNPDMPGRECNVWKELTG